MRTDELYRKLDDINQKPLAEIGKKELVEELPSFLADRKPEKVYGGFDARTYTVPHQDLEDGEFFFVRDNASCVWIQGPQTDAACAASFSHGNGFEQEILEKSHEVKQGPSGEVIHRPRPYCPEHEGPNPNAYQGTYDHPDARGPDTGPSVIEDGDLGGRSFIYGTGLKDLV